MSTPLVLEELGARGGEGSPSSVLLCTSFVAQGELSCPTDLLACLLILFPEGVPMLPGLHIF